MASGSYWQAYVVCPYYLSDDGKRSVDCEGVTDSSRVRMCFRTQADFEKYMGHYCCRHYGDCGISRAIHATYEGVFENDH